MDSEPLVTDDTESAPDGEVKRHPIRGALWGIPMGIGLTFFLIGQKVISLGTWAPFLTFLLGIVLGVAWAMFAPPKKAKEPESAGLDDPPAAPPDLAQPAPDA